jgi:hypothetical protein
VEIYHYPNSQLKLIPIVNIILNLINKINKEKWHLMNATTIRPSNKFQWPRAQEDPEQIRTGHKA